MPSVYRRGNKLWIKVRIASGRYKAMSTEFRPGQEAAARRVAEELERRVDDGQSVDTLLPKAPTVRQYAKRFLSWCRDTVDGGVRIRDWKNYRGLLEIWVLPVIGDQKLAAVRRADILEVVNRARQAKSKRGKPLSSRRVRNVYGVMQSMFRQALADELVEFSPCTLNPRYDLPKIADADPEWRATAIYTRDEIELITQDDRVPEDRRILYSLEFFARARHGEAAGMRWRHWLQDRRPLSALVVTSSYDSGRTKSDTVREVPVHPVLESLLRDWWAFGWKRTMGRSPTLDDLIVPATPEEQARRRTRKDEMRRADLSRDYYKEDLERLGLRYRRGHDLGSTFISWAREDGARGDVLKHCTHGKPNTIIEQYSRLSWETYCAEVLKLKMKRRSRGAVIVLPVAKAAGMEGQVEVLGTDLGTPGDPTSATSRGWSTSPTGFEAVSPQPIV